MQGEPPLQQIASDPLRRPLGLGRRASVGHAARAAILTLAPILLVGTLAWPMLFTHAGFNEDWIHHLWFVWNQSLALRDNHEPTFFINYTHSVFYPEYAFYGATLYVIVGSLSLALGDAPTVAYVVAYLLGFAISYGGWYWMARMAGLRGWWAHVPGVIFITSAYYLTLVYARGDLPEFTGVSTIPLLIASALSVLRARRLRGWPALALAGSAVVFFGSHSLTILWGCTSMALVSLAVVVYIPAARRLLTRRGVLRVASLVIPAALVSAWFLLPAIVYQSHTDISNKYPFWRLVAKSTSYLVSAENLFAISRVSAVSPASEFVLSLPILAMAWALISILVCWRARLWGMWAKALLVFVGVGFVVTIVMTHTGIILALPRPYAMIQYTYRLESYIMLATSGAVLAGLAALRKGTRRVQAWTWVLAPILIVAIVGAIQQTDAYPRYGGNREVAVESSTRVPPREISLTDYTDAHLPTLADPNGRPAEVNFSAASVHDNRASTVVHLQPGQLVYSDIAAGPEIVHVTGAKIVGRDPEDNDVLEIAPGNGAPASRGASGKARAKSAHTETISLSTASTLPLVLGRVLSLAGLALLIGVFGALAARRLFASTDERGVRAR
ncbi:MAG TPA: hypothetical protein VK756_01300 [Solirubrobacteraceae bacterium]|nr:hypothetical protein [Solirubrobacteraceae bacterium]